MSPRHCHGHSPLKDIAARRINTACTSTVLQSKLKNKRRTDGQQSSNRRTHRCLAVDGGGIDCPDLEKKFFLHVVFILYFCRRFGRPSRVPRGKPVQVRRSPAAVSSIAEAQSVKSLYVAIDTWEDRVEESKPEDLPNHENRYRFRGKSTPVTDGSAAFLFPLCEIPPFPVLILENESINNLKQYQLW